MKSTSKLHNTYRSLIKSLIKLSKYDPTLCNTIKQSITYHRTILKSPISSCIPIMSTLDELILKVLNNEQVNIYDMFIGYSRNRLSNQSEYSQITHTTQPGTYNCVRNISRQKQQNHYPWIHSTDNQIKMINNLQGVLSCGYVIVNLILSIRLLINICRLKVPKVIYILIQSVDQEIAMINQMNNQYQQQQNEQNDKEEKNNQHQQEQHNRKQIKLKTWKGLLSQNSPYLWVYKKLYVRKQDKIQQMVQEIIDNRIILI